MEIHTTVKNKELVIQKREQIILSAITLFSKKGFQKTTLKDIAEMTGLSQGNIYGYIESKQDIFYLSGHIDFLFFFNDCLYVCDYKPEARDRIFLKSIPQVSVYGLLLEEILNILNLKIKCITFNKTDAWEYEPSILYTHIKDIVRELKIDYPIDAKWETYLSQYFDFS